jgi:hypothetical protein
LPRVSSAHDFFRVLGQRLDHGSGRHAVG